MKTKTKTSLTLFFYDNPLHHLKEYSMVNCNLFQVVYFVTYDGIYFVDVYYFSLCDVVLLGWILSRSWYENLRLAVRILILYILEKQKSSVNGKLNNL